MRVRFLAIQTNDAGRPCGWGLATSIKAAKEEARRQYAAGAHAKDPRGEMVLHALECEGDAPEQDGGAS